MSKKSKKEEAHLSVEEAAAVVLPAAEAAVSQKAKADKKTAKAEKKAAKQLKKATKEAKKAQKAVKGDKHKKKCKKSKVFGCPIRNLVVTAVMSLLLGAAFLVKPVMVYTYCGYGLGGLVALAGLIYIIIYFARKPVGGEYRSEFAIGLMAFLAGAYVAAGGLLTGSSGTSITFANIIRILGVLIAADGIMKLQYALDVARMKYPKWWIGLITAVLGLALGVVTVMGITYELGTDMLGSSGGMMMLGIVIAVNGVLDLVSMIVVAVRNHKAEKAAVLAEAEAILAARAVKEEAEAGNDFFTTDDSSATGENAPAEEVTPASETLLAPEPQIELVEEKPAPDPVAAEPAPAPDPVPAAEEPILPEPELASPAPEEE